MAEYASDGSQQVVEREPDMSAEGPDSAAPDGAPEPWYRNRVLLALWALMVALLLTLVVYGIAELSRGGGGETNGPAKRTSSTSSTAPARSSPTAPTTTPSTTTETPPPPETPEQTPEEAPPPAANNSPAPAEPPQHHHHHPHIPSTVTLPHTVVTLPHGF
jgi:hypothetical protein